MIEFFTKDEIEAILIKSGFEKGLLTMATRLLNEKLTKLLSDIIEGVSVSVDVSTGEYDSGNRLFGIVNEVMEYLYDKNGYTLLVYETEPNFGGFELLDWNEISAMGLLETINTEIMHPKGLAVFRDPKTGLSGGALVAPDGVFTY